MRKRQRVALLVLVISLLMAASSATLPAAAVQSAQSVTAVMAESHTVLDDEHFYADTYGYNDCREHPTDSRDAADKATALLRKGGYESFSNYIATSQTAIRNLGRDRVFSFIGHANNTRLLFVDNGCAESYLLGTDVASTDWRGANDQWRLVLLTGCKTGEDVAVKGSIMKGFFDKGADMVIGHAVEINVRLATRFHEQFWKHAITDRMECEDAALAAARDVRNQWWWPRFIREQFSEDSIIVLGLQDVYLVPPQDPGSEPPAVPWWRDIADRLRQWLADARQKVRDWWKGIGDDLQKRLLDWWQKLQEDLLRRLQEALQREVQKLCGGLVPLGLVVAVAAARRQRGVRHK